MQPESRRHFLLHRSYHIVKKKKKTKKLANTTVACFIKKRMLNALHSRAAYNVKSAKNTNNYPKKIELIEVANDSNSEDSIQMSPGSNSLRLNNEMHSPKSAQHINDPTANSNSLSPSSVSPRTMSPPNENRNGFINDAIGNYQQSFANAVAPYQTNVQPKKSFCIDALLSKNHQNNGDQSPEGNRFLSDDDTGNKYSDDQREYMSSPEDGISR